MNQKLLILGFIVALVALGVLFFGSDNKDAKKEVSSIVTSSSSSIESKQTSNIEIKFEKSDEKKIESSSSSSVSLAANKQDEKQVTPNVITGTMVRTSKYEIMLAADSKIVAKKSDLPLAPTLISGTIDGEPFNILLPSALENEDIRFVVREMSSGQTKVSSMKLGALEPGSKYNAQLYFYSLDTIVFGKDSSQNVANDLPPMPPMFR